MTNVNNQKEVLTKKDADFIFLEYTRSVCPKCLKPIDAQVIIRDGKVFMQKRCTEHGFFETLIFSDANIYVNSSEYNKPGTIPHHFASEINEGCPNDCGICPNHKQHTCVGVLEVTSKCNMGCPVCFADSKGKGYALPLSKIEELLDLYVKCEGNPEVIQISGGEPTLHPQLFEILDAAYARNITCVMLNTNGIKIAEDEDLARRLAEKNVRIYFQFDGFKPETYKTIRGKDYTAMKMKALDNLLKYNAKITLVSTIIKGINDDEIGDILKFAIKTKGVQRVMYQPATFVGRTPGLDTMDRMTLTDVTRAIEEQTSGLLQQQDFVPLPCPHPTCTHLTYMVIKDGNVLPIPRYFNVKDHLNYLENSARPDISPLIKKNLEGMWSASADLESESTTQGVQQTILSCCDSIDLKSQGLGAGENLMAVAVKAFMDENTFDFRRAMKCCVHQILPNGKMIPFCVYNTLKRKDMQKEFEELYK